MMAMMTMRNATTITIKMTTTITITMDGEWNRMTTTMRLIKTITATTTIIFVNNNNTIDSICLLQLIIHAMAL